MLAFLLVILAVGPLCDASGQRLYVDGPAALRDLSGLSGIQGFGAKDIANNIISKTKDIANNIKFEMERPLINTILRTLGNLFSPPIPSPDPKSSPLRVANNKDTFQQLYEPENNDDKKINEDDSEKSKEKESYEAPKYNSDEDETSTFFAENNYEETTQHVPKQQKYNKNKGINKKKINKQKSSKAPKVRETENEYDGPKTPKERETENEYDGPKTPKEKETENEYDGSKKPKEREMEDEYDGEARKFSHSTAGDVNRDRALDFIFGYIMRRFLDNTTGERVVDYPPY